MKKKRRIKKSIKKKLFYGIIIVNIIWILLLIGYYSYRLYYYYQEEHKESADTSYLVDTLTLDKNITTKEDGLHYKNEEYWYQGNVTNNYVWYSGLLWRIVSIDQNRNIKLVTDEVITILSYHGTGFVNSDVYQWLNPTNQLNTGIFYHNLNENGKLLVETDNCLDNISSPTNVTCKKVKTSKVGLLSLYDYDQAKGKNSYLNTGQAFYTASLKSKEEVWLIQKDGTLSTVKTENTGNGVRPVITLKNTTVLYSGNGTKDKPYQIENRKKELLSDVNVGEYVTYSNGSYRVIAKEKENVKVMANEVLPSSRSFSEDSIVYDTKEYGTLAYQINNEYTEYYDNPEWIKAGTFYYGFYRGKEDSYQSIYQSKLVANIGLPQVGDYFIDDISGIYTMNPSNMENSTMITIENGKYFADFVTKEKKIRPVFYLDGNLKISGEGTKESPYQLGV